MRFAIAAVLAVGCGGDEHSPPDAPGDVCTAPTTYLGVERDCMGGAGVCIAQGPATTCYVKCGTGPAGACTMGFHWETQATVSAEVCYCVPG